MIGFLTGKIHSKQPPFLWLDVNGVGYEIEAPMTTFYALPEVQQQATLFIHTHVREDAMLLFGFATQEEKTLYRTLIKVNGVGAKMALAILSTMSVAEFVQLVESSDSLGLTRIPGVGKKTAERLVIEMKDRLKELHGISAPTPIFAAAEAPQANASLVQQSAIDALIALGYKTNQAEKMIKDAVKAQPDLSLEGLIKAALQSVKI